MSGHTPGPWVYDDDTATIDNDLGVSVAGINVDLHNYEANACLIAAAPELLTQLKNLQWAITQDVMTSYPGVAIEIRATEALIAKAEGRQP